MTELGVPMRTLLRICLLPLAMVASAVIAQDFSQKVTYEASGISAKRVLQELSAITKVQMDTAPITATEVLMIGVKDVSLKELMDRIAEVTSGRWIQEGDLWRLGADNAKRTQEVQAERQERIKAVQKAIDQLTKPRSKD